MRLSHCLTALVIVLPGCDSRAGQPEPPQLQPPAGAAEAGADAVPIADGMIHGADGAMLGWARLARLPSGEGRLRLELSGLTPGRHGVHIHEAGACDGTNDVAFSSAGGHFNPGGRQHGRHNPEGWHAGDLPNLEVDAGGAATLEVVLDAAWIDDGPGTLFDADGSAVVVHANEDDEVTDSGPAGPGNSGARIGCAVLMAR